MKPAPKIKRTRRHVVVRLSPAEAKTAAMMARGIPRDQLPPALRRGAVRVLSILCEADRVGATTLPPAPKPTSIRHSLTLIEADEINPSR